MESWFTTGQHHSKTRGRSISRFEEFGIQNIAYGIELETIPNAKNFYTQTIIWASRLDSALLCDFGYWRSRINSVNGVLCRVDSTFMGSTFQCIWSGMVHLISMMAIAAWLVWCKGVFFKSKRTDLISKPACSECSMAVALLCMEVRNAGSCRNQSAMDIDCTNAGGILEEE